MAQSDRYRANADECLTLAEATQDSEYRALYRNMSACWRALAVTAGLAEDGAGFAALGERFPSEKDVAGGLRGL